MSDPQNGGGAGRREHEEKNIIKVVTKWLASGCVYGLQETPSATEVVFSPTTKDLKELLLKETPAASPVETILVPAATTVPAVAVSGSPPSPPPACIPEQMCMKQKKR